MIAMATQFFRRELSASWMLFAVMAHFRMTVEAEWNAVVVRIIAALGSRYDMMAFYTYAGKLVAQATAPLTRDQSSRFCL